MQFYLVRAFLRAIGEYAEYCHKERNHQGRDDVSLFPSPRFERKRDHPIQCQRSSEGCQNITVRR